MMRTKQWGMIVGTLATAVVFAFSSQANAGWGSSGGWGSSSSGSGGSWGSSSSGSSGGFRSGWGSSSSSSGGWGSSSSGGWVARHHAHRQYRRAMRSSSSGGFSSSSGGWGSSSSGGYSYGSASSSSGGSGYHAEGNWVPAEAGDAPAEKDAPTPPQADPQTSIRDRNTSVSFSVTVPEDAQVFVNDNATTSTGTERTYVSRGLQAGRSYTFQVRAELVRDGKTLTETKQIRLVAGEHESLAFEFAPKSDEQLADKPVETKLTLHVPAEAKVYLSGHATAATGETREFATTKLIPGKSWADYTVVVTLEKDGQLLSQEKNVTINAGDSREVTFDFDADKVAVNN